MQLLSYINRVLCIYVLCLLLDGVVFAQQQTITEKNIAQENTEQKTILVMGDSLSASYKMAQAKGWVNLLQIHLQNQPLVYKVHNASIAGETSRGGVSRLPKLLAELNPEVVIIELGGNDALRGSSITNINNNLQKMIKLSQTAKAKVLLIGIQLPPNYGKRYNELLQQMYAELAQKNDTALLPFLLQSIALEEGMMQADGIHASEKAQPLIMLNVWQYLQPLL